MDQGYTTKVSDPILDEENPCQKRWEYFCEMMANFDEAYENTDPSSSVIKDILGYLEKEGYEILLEGYRSYKINLTSSGNILVLNSLRGFQYHLLDKDNQKIELSPDGVLDIINSLIGHVVYFSQAINLQNNSIIEYFDSLDEEERKWFVAKFKLNEGAFIPLSHDDQQYFDDENRDPPPLIPLEGGQFDLPTMSHLSPLTIPIDLRQSEPSFRECAINALPKRSLNPDAKIDYLLKSADKKGILTDLSENLPNLLAKIAIEPSKNKKSKTLKVELAKFGNKLIKDQLSTKEGEVSKVATLDMRPIKTKPESRQLQSNLASSDFLPQNQSKDFNSDTFSHEGGEFPLKSDDDSVAQLGLSSNYQQVKSEDKKVPKSTITRKISQREEDGDEMFFQSKSLKLANCSPKESGR